MGDSKTWGILVMGKMILKWGEGWYPFTDSPFSTKCQKFLAYFASAPSTFQTLFISPPSISSQKTNPYQIPSTELNQLIYRIKSQTSLSFFIGNFAFIAAKQFQPQFSFPLLSFVTCSCIRNCLSSLYYTYLQGYFWKAPAKN